MFDIIRPFFGIVDYLQDPHVRKAIFWIFIFIILAYNWQIINSIVFQLLDYILGMCKIDQFSLAIDVLAPSYSATIHCATAHRIVAIAVGITSSLTVSFSRLV